MRSPGRKSFAALRPGNNPMFNQSVLVILRQKLEIGLRVGAHGAKLRGFLAHDDVTTVDALPDALAIATENEVTLHILQQLAVALLVGLLHRSHAVKEGGDVVKPFLAGLLAAASFKLSSVPGIAPPCRSLNQILACSFSLRAVSSKSWAICTNPSFLALEA